MPLRIASLAAFMFLVGCASLNSKSRAPWNDHPIVTQCMILDAHGALRWSYPAWLCVFLPDGRFITGDVDGLYLRGADLKSIWHHDFVPHHMISLAKNGDILTLASEYKAVSEQKPGFSGIVEVDIPKKIMQKKTEIPADVLRRKFRVDKIVRLNQDGKIVAEKRLINDAGYPLKWLVRDWAWMSPRVAPPALEVSHLNSIYEIPPNASPLPAFKAGNILVNDTLNRVVFILDDNLKEILWRFRYQPLGYLTVHDIQVLKNGNILLLKNSSEDSSQDSSLEEIDPVTHKVVWTHHEKPDGSFRASKMGSVQPLGENFLYAHTTNGKSHATMIDRSGKIVWQLDLNRHTDVGLQGAYQLPVEEFLRHNRQHQVFNDYPEIDFLPKIAKSQSLLVRKWPVKGKEEARTEILAQASILRRYLAKQIDPYRGETTQRSNCDIPGRQQEKIAETENELSLAFLLVTAKSRAIDCYGTAADRMYDQRLYLFCKKAGALYEINYYSPMKNEELLSEPLAHCR